MKFFTKFLFKNVQCTVVYAMHGHRKYLSKSFKRHIFYKVERKKMSIHKHRSDAQERQVPSVETGLPRPSALASQHYERMRMPKSGLTMKSLMD